MPRISKPDVNNRAEALSYWWSFLGYKSDYSSDLGKRRLSLQDSIDCNDTNAFVPARQIALTYADAMQYQRWRAMSQAVTTLQEAFSSFYWALEFELSMRDSEKIPDTSCCRCFWEIMKWQGIAAACGEAWFVEWAASYVQRFMAKEVAFEHMLTLDEQGRAFLDLLQHIILTKQWPKQVSESELGAFTPLFNDANHPKQFEQTLIMFCDYRMAQTYGYPYMGAEKKRKRGKEWSIFEEEIFLSGVWPTELLTLKYAYEQATGQLMSLDAPHPLLQSNMMKLPFPKLTPLVEDETNEKIKAFAKKLYGEAWQPFINPA